MFFNKKKKEEDIEIPEHPLRDPLLAIPIIPEHVEVRYDDYEIIHLRSMPTAKSLNDNIRKVLRQDYSRKVELDEHGTFCYRLIDGQHNLRYIAEQFAKKYEQDRHTSNMQIIMFFKELMKKNLVALRIDK